MSELDKLKKQLCLYKLENNKLNAKYKFYKSIFRSHNNSVVLNLQIKKINGSRVWVDPICDDIEFIKSLDRDDEVTEWLKPIKFEK
jgi:hypothetical protein